jgi:tetratricopeptide (TPR) repeat protein
MDVDEAWDILHEYYRSKAHADFDSDAFIEASEYLLYLYEGKDLANWETAAFNLASFYYCHDRYDMALKYYKQLMIRGSDTVSTIACVNTANYYYYGHDEENDIEKALYYCDQALKLTPDDLRAKVLRLAAAGLADNCAMTMKEYSDAVFDLFKEVKVRLVPGVISVPLPEIELLAAELLLSKDLKEPAHGLIGEARAFLSDRLLSSEDPDDLTLMFSLIDLDPDVQEEIDIYDLTWLLHNCTAILTYGDDEYFAGSVEENGEQVVRFNDRYYRNPENFIRRASIDGIRLNRIADRINVEIFDPSGVKAPDGYFS